jgi:hypothetical protein
MDFNRVIRVEIDPSAITHLPLEESGGGYLRAELAEFKQALAQEGGKLTTFLLPDWFHRANSTVVKKVTPSAASGDAVFHQQVQADMKEMLDLLNKMALMMAAWKPPASDAVSSSSEPPAKPSPPAAAPATIRSTQEETLYYLIPSD